MSYFPDLSPYTYGGARRKRVLNVGWLDKAHPYAHGETSRPFRERLELLCKNTPVMGMHMGYHGCEFCERWRGNAVIAVEGIRGTYAAPALIYHYVVAHDYRPPDEFIEAVLEAPLPGSRAYGETFGSDFLCVGLVECDRDGRPTRRRRTSRDRRTLEDAARFLVQVVESRPTHTAVIRSRVARKERSTFVVAACGEVWSFVRAAGVPRPGRHFALYLGHGMVEAGTEVLEPFAGNDRVVCSQLPAGRVATIRQFGPPSQLAEAHAELRRWCAEHGHRLTGVSGEIYGQWDESWNTDPAKIQTDVFYVLAEPGS